MTDPAKQPEPWEGAALHPKLGRTPTSMFHQFPAGVFWVQVKGLKNEYSHCLRFLEFSHLLNVVHEVPAVDVLHDEVQPVLDTRFST